MPRYWFVAGDKVNLIQVQKDAFMLNWRRQDMGYPNFSNIKPVYDRYYVVFSDFVRDELGVELAIASCELTYVNIIEQPELWSGAGDTERIIDSFSIPDIGLLTVEYLGFNCNFGYRVASDLLLNVSIRSGSVNRQSEVPVLVFEIKASGQPQRNTKSRADAWFDRAHVAVNECFLHLTSDEVQRTHWGINEV